MNRTRGIFSSLLAGSLAVGGASSVLAAGGHPGRLHGTPGGFAYGRASNVSSTGFTVTSTPRKAGVAAKSVKVTVPATVKETPSTGTTGALVNGDYVWVVGTPTANGLTAQQVRYSTTLAAARPHLRNRAIGTVDLAKSTATSLVITTKAGTTLTFVLNAQTKYVVNRQVATAAPALTSAERVSVQYRQDATTKALIAVRVTVVPASATK